jgi:hypothetical protein
MTTLVRPNLRDPLLARTHSDLATSSFMISVVPA